MRQERIEQICETFWIYMLQTERITQEEYDERKDKVWTVDTLKEEIKRMGFNEHGHR